MSKTLLAAALLFFAASVASAQKKPPAFEVASVKPSSRAVGPDYNNQFEYSPSGFSARNVTLTRLMAEAYRLQLNQVYGPRWISETEYDVEAQASGPVPREQLSLMLRTLLSERFHLRLHSETRNVRVYELVANRPKLPQTNPSPPQATTLHFHGDMRRFADLVAVRLTIPDLKADPTKPSIASGPPITVLDKTGLNETYDLALELKSELGTDAFTQWQRILKEQLGLSLTSRKSPVDVVVIDDALKTPTPN